jgi:hypothetical protein
MIAVVAGNAAIVDVEPDAAVRVYPGGEVGDADGDVVDALENACYSAGNVPTTALTTTSGLIGPVWGNCLPGAALPFASL